jgi:hypothetical protein
MPDIEEVAANERQWIIGGSYRMSAQTTAGRSSILPGSACHPEPPRHERQPWLPQSKPDGGLDKRRGIALRVTTTRAEA